jgi:hypothetical protein
MASNGTGHNLPDQAQTFWDGDLQRYACLLCWLPPEMPAETCTARPRALHLHLLICTREPGHEGAHAACGACQDQHPYHIWNDGE